MKGIVIIAGILTLAGFASAQSLEKPEKQPKIKEVPSDASHGKTISELAKTTPGGREKGKIISSAARQKGLEQRGGRAPNENAEEHRKNNRPSNESKGKGVVGSGKQISPRPVPASKPKSGGFNGGS